MESPGAYSLNSINKNADEKKCRDTILDVETYGVIVILESSNFERQLLLASQIMDLGKPMALVITNIDIMKAVGKRVDVEALEKHFQVPVYAMVARNQHEVKRFAQILQDDSLGCPEVIPWKYREDIQNALHDLVKEVGVPQAQIVRQLTGQDDTLLEDQRKVCEALLEGRWRDALCDFRKQDILTRSRWIKSVSDEVIIYETAEEAEKAKVKKLLNKQYFLRIIIPAAILLAIGIYFKFRILSGIMERVSN